MQKDAVKDEFSTKIGRLTQSRAYLDFCEQVYGVRAYLFNMMDSEQLDYVLRLIPITPGDTVLDLGCGTGSILALLVKKYGCAGIGIDLLDSVTTENRAMARYICGDIDAFAGYGITPSVTLSVDSLYFCSDPAKLVLDLSRIANNRLYLFYSQYLFEENADRSLLESHNTRLGQALSKAGVSFRTADFSENERRLYFRMEKALKGCERAFAAEGNADLHEEKLREVRLGTELFETGRAARYLYIGEAAHVLTPHGPHALQSE